MPLDLDTLVIETDKSITVESILQDYNLWSKVNPALNQIPQSIKRLILDIPVKENKSVRLAGYWEPTEKTIYLNYLLDNENSNHYIDTFLHELAHAIVGFTGKNDYRDHHGSEWQRIMLQMRQTPDRCHKYSFYLRKEQRNNGGK